MIIIAAIIVHFNCQLAVTETKTKAAIVIQGIKNVKNLKVKIKWFIDFMINFPIKFLIKVNLTILIKIIFVITTTFNFNH